MAKKAKNAKKTSGASNGGAGRKRATAQKRATARRDPTTSAGGASADDERLTPAADELIVRMYRQGLGDCFLLAVGVPDGGRPKFVLVDCGVHTRQDEGTKRLAQVTEHLARTVDRRLDVVVATHEHADHLSGFVQKGSPFLRSDFLIDACWLAWTEKPDDEQAVELRRKHGSARAVIERALNAARERAGAAADRLSRSLEDVLSFEDAEDVDEREVRYAIAAARETTGRGDVFEEERLDRAGSGGEERGGSPGAAAVSPGADARPSSNELAIALLASKGVPRFCDPTAKDRVVELDGVPGFRAYVLGPPRDPRLLKKDLPSKTADGGHGEVYWAGGGASLSFARSPALDGDAADAPGTATREASRAFPAAVARPFVAADGRFEWTRPDCLPEATRELFDESYLTREHAWRRIDGDWLGAAERLALHLDSDTNNTSLALAFEWGPPGEGRVLLFPGDAQVGNWTSWRGLSFRVADRRVTTADLLDRTVVYKVGHHASHNATARAAPSDPADPQSPLAPFGLELMDDIVALVPVDRAAADKAMPTPWAMPHRPLYERLRAKARRRVLRADHSLAPLEADAPPDVVPATTRWTPVPGLPNAWWRKASESFAAGAAGPLYFDVKLKR